jgi:peptidoglycan/LPS O-acetylase OafA/YrhL
MLAALAFTKVLGRRRVVLVLWLLSWVVAAGIDLTGGVDVPTDSGFVHFILKVLIRFTPIFFAGAVIWLYRDKVPDNRYLFTAALLIFVGGTFLPHPDLVGPALGYVCLWASIHMPGKSIGSKYDISYGVYIYAFVVAQLFTLWHVNKWGYLPYTALTTLVTLALAGLSCVFVEQPALRLKRWTPPFIQRRTQGRL